MDLAGVREPIGQLVIRLRHAGIAVSDRRAVKMQRLVAASALLCGRDRAVASDLWVFRHIWDTVEQQEVLAAVVADLLKQAAASPADHPRPAATTAPTRKASPATWKTRPQTRRRRGRRAPIAPPSRTASACWPAAANGSKTRTSGRFCLEKVEALWARAK